MEPIPDSFVDFYNSINDYVIKGKAFAMPSLVDFAEIKFKLPDDENFYEDIEGKGALYDPILDRFIKDVTLFHPSGESMMLSRVFEIFVEEMLGLPWFLHRQDDKVLSLGEMCLPSIK